MAMDGVTNYGEILIYFMYHVPPGVALLYGCDSLPRPMMGDAVWHSCRLYCHSYYEIWHDMGPSLDISTFHPRIPTEWIGDWIA